MTPRFEVRQLNGILVWTPWDTQFNVPSGELFVDLSACEKDVARLNKTKQPDVDESRVRIGLYARISDDSEEKGEGVLRQLQDDRKLADKLNAQIFDYYVDNDTSASTRTNVPRPDYARLLDDARKDVIKLIGAYSNGRVTRRPLELEDLIVLYEQHQTVIHTSVSGQDDLSTADGRMVARIKASIDAAEVERLAERVTRQKLMRAEQGKPQGGRYRTYGFTKDWKLVPEELGHMADAFKRRAEGESITSIANDMVKKGIKTSTGNDWTAGILGTNLGNPVYAGLRRYKGEIIGKLSQESVPHVKDVFPVVSEETFALVQSELVKDSKGTNARTHLGSGFLICKNCLTKMKGNAYTKNYRCSTTYGGCGKISIRMKHTDRYLIFMMMTEHLTATAKKNKAAAVKPRDFEAELLEVENAIKRLQEGYTAEVYTLREVQPLLKEQREKLKLLQKERHLEQPQARGHNHLKTYMDFHKMTRSQQRATISDYIENVVVLPRKGKGNHIFDSQRLEFHFKDGRIEFPDDTMLEESENVE